MAESMTSIWVHAANVKEVDGHQGFVDVTTDLADKLIEAGKAQNPNIGGLHLKELDDPGSPMERKKKVMSAETSQVQEETKSEPPKPAATSKRTTYIAKR